MTILFTVFCVVLYIEATLGFVPNLQLKSSLTCVQAGKGFGKGSGKGFAKEYNGGKSYGEDVRNPIKDLIDSESAMKEFFSSNDQYHPLFQSFARSSSVPGMSFMSDVVESFDFHEDSAPWKRLDGIPTSDEDREVLASFLDNMQSSLVSIPVDETTKEDDNDLQFIEEGRRMLVLSRFHVIKGSIKGSIESHDALFSTCWSELMYLKEADEIDTGSLILVPDFDMTDLRRFTDMNIQRPLQWLGMDETFEVASFQRGSPAIRLIHKLSDIPTTIPAGPDDK